MFACRWCGETYEELITYKTMPMDSAVALRGESQRRGLGN